MFSAFMRKSTFFRVVCVQALAAFVFAIAVPELAMAEKVQIPAGTVVALRTNDTLNPEYLNVGDIVGLTVINDVVIDGKVVIASGAAAKGEVVQASKRSMIGIPAKIALSIRSVAAVDGSTIMLMAGKNVQGSNKMAISIGLTLFCCILFLLMKGGAAEIPAGAQIDAQVSGTATVEVP